LDRMDIILCMGAGVSMAQGLEKAGERRRIVGVVGDSTFFHSGITGLLDIVYNKGRSTIIVLDNRTTAMTGHQDHPGTGRTLMGQATKEISIEAIGRACGIERIRTVDPYKLQDTLQAIAEEIEADEPSLIISQSPCPLREKRRLGEPLRISAKRCQACHRCLKLACPAIECPDEKPSINQVLCSGCGLCEQLCPFEAVVRIP